MGVHDLCPCIFLIFFILFNYYFFSGRTWTWGVHMTLLKLYHILPPCYPVLLYACMAVLDSSRLLGGGRLLRLHLWFVLDPGLTLLHVVFRVFPRVLSIIGSTTEEGTLRPRFPDAQTLGRDRCAAAGCP